MVVTTLQHGPGTRRSSRILRTVRRWLAQVRGGVCGARCCASSARSRTSISLVRLMAVVAELSWVRRCDDVSMEELNAWAQRAEKRGRLPATARTGSLTAAPLVTPQGALSHQPAAVSSEVELDSGRYYPTSVSCLQSWCLFSVCALVTTGDLHGSRCRVPALRRCWLPARGQPASNASNACESKLLRSSN